MAGETVVMYPVQNFTDNSLEDELFTNRIDSGIEFRVVSPGDVFFNVKGEDSNKTGGRNDVGLSLWDF